MTMMVFLEGSPEGGGGIQVDISRAQQRPQAEQQGEWDSGRGFSGNHWGEFSPATKAQHGRPPAQPTNSLETTF